MTSKIDYYVYVYHYSNGVPFYVGKGRGNRCLHHLKRARGGKRGDNPYLDRTLRKILMHRDQVQIQKAHVGLTEQEAFDYEKKLIIRIGRKTTGGPLVNLTDGGEGPSGYQMYGYHKAALLAAIKGKPLSPEHRRKIGEGNSRRVYTPEMRRRMGDIRRGTKLSEKQRLALLEGCVAYWTGRKRSVENRARISATLTGRHATEEARAKMSATRRGVPLSPKTRERMKAAWVLRRAKTLRS